MTPADLKLKIGNLAHQYFAELPPEAITEERGYNSFMYGEESLLSFVDKWIELEERKGKCRIFSSQSRSFNDIYVDESRVVVKCKQIWNNPEKYSRYKYGTEDAYYKFLKFLWVKYPDGKEQQLADIANNGHEARH